MSLSSDPCDMTIRLNRNEVEKRSKFSLLFTIFYIKKCALKINRRCFDPFRRLSYRGLKVDACAEGNVWQYKSLQTIGDFSSYQQNRSSHYPLTNFIGSFVGLTCYLVSRANYLSTEIITLPELGYQILHYFTCSGAEAILLNTVLPMLFTHISNVTRSLLYQHGAIFAGLLSASLRYPFSFTNIERRRDCL